MAQRDPMEDPMVGLQTRNLQNLLEKFGTEAIKPLENVVEKMKTSKFQKSVKNLRGTFDSMIKASIQGAILEKFMILLEPFLNIIDLLTPLFEILGGILQKALMPVMEALLPIIMLLADFLKENEDIIIELIELALVPLIELLALVMEYLPPIFPYLRLLLEGLRTLARLLDLVVGWLFGHSPGLLPGLERMAELINELVGLIFGSLVKVFNAATDAIKAFLSFLTDIANILKDVILGAMDRFNNALKELNTFLENLVALIREIKSIGLPGTGGGGGSGGGGGGGLLEPIEDIIYGAEGGVAMRPTLGVFGEAGPEALVPLRRFNEVTGNIEMLRAIEQNSDELKEIKVYLQQVVRR